MPHPQVLISHRHTTPHRHLPSPSSTHTHHNTQHNTQHNTRSKFSLCVCVRAHHQPGGASSQRPQERAEHAAAPLPGRGPRRLPGPLAPPPRPLFSIPPLPCGRPLAVALCLAASLLPPASLPFCWAGRGARRRRESCPRAPPCPSHPPPSQSEWLMPSHPCKVPPPCPPAVSDCPRAPLPFARLCDEAFSCELELARARLRFVRGGRRGGPSLQGGG